MGFLEFVREAGERGEPHAPSLVAGADRERCREHRFPGAAVADEDDALAVIDPRSLGERGDRGLRHVGVILEAEVLQAFDLREAGVDQSALLAPLGAFGHLGLQQRPEVGDRGLLLAQRFGRERPEAPADGRELQLDRVRLDQRLQRRGLRVAGRRGHRSCLSVAGQLFGVLGHRQQLKRELACLCWPQAADGGLESGHGRRSSSR